MATSRTVSSDRPKVYNKDGTTRKVLGELGRKLLSMKEKSNGRLPPNSITKLISEAESSAGVKITKPMLQRAVTNLKKNPNYYGKEQSAEVPPPLVVKRPLGSAKKGRKKRKAETSDRDLTNNTAKKFAAGQHKRCKESGNKRVPAGTLSKTAREEAKNRAMKRKVLGELGKKLLSMKEKSIGRIPRDSVTKLISEADSSGVKVTKPMLTRAVANLKKNPNHYEKEDYEKETRYAGILLGPAEKWKKRKADRDCMNNIAEKYAVEHKKCKESGRRVPKGTLSRIGREEAAKLGLPDDWTFSAETIHSRVYKDHNDRVKGKRKKTIPAMNALRTAKPDRADWWGRELKTALRYYGERVSGTKKELRDRLEALLDGGGARSPVCSPCPSDDDEEEEDKEAKEEDIEDNDSDDSEEGVDTDDNDSDSQEGVDNDDNDSDSQEGVDNDDNDSDSEEEVDNDDSGSEEDDNDSDDSEEAMNRAKEALNELFRTLHSVGLLDLLTVVAMARSHFANDDGVARLSDKQINEEARGILLQAAGGKSG